MTLSATLPPHRRRACPADTPDDLVAPEDLGRVVNLEELKSRFDPQVVQSFVDHMLLADEVGYAAYKAIRPLRAEGRDMVEQALQHGIDSVDNPPAELIALFNELDTVPQWVDWDQLNRGCIAMWRAGRFVPICLGYSSIGYGFGSYGGTKALNFTRLLVDEDRAGTRMAETLRWVAAVSTPDGMRRDGVGFKYSVRVRLVHCAVRFGISKSPKWQWNEWGMPITNTDLFLTTSRVFCANVVEALGRLGIRYTDREKDDIFALWRYIGYVMGVPDELNFVNRQDSLTRNAIVEAVEHEPDEANRILLHSLIGYSTKNTDGYQPIPPALLNRMTQRQKIVMSYGLIRHLTGDEFCESMHIPDTRFRHVVAGAGKLIACREVVTSRRTKAHARQAWRTLRAVEKALAIEDAEAIASPDEVQQAVRRNEANLESTLQQPVRL